MSTVLVTGASSGFGRMTALALAKAGHTVYASMRSLEGRAAAELGAIERIVPIALDVTSDASVEAAFARIHEKGPLDVLIHNAGHMAFGPAEAFTPEQLMALYDVNVVGSQRVNRAALPAMRAARRGLVVWVGSSSTRGGTPPFLAPYFAAKAGMDALAQSYALELSRFGIETTIVVPGAFTKGTNHFAHAAHPGDTARAEAWSTGAYAGVTETALKGLAALEPADADPESVARAIADVVALPSGKRPFRVHVGPSADGAEIVNAVADRVRAQLLERIGLADLLRVRKEN